MKADRTRRRCGKTNTSAEINCTKFVLCCGRKTFTWGRTAQFLLISILASKTSTYGRIQWQFGCRERPLLPRFYAGCEPYLEKEKIPDAVVAALEVQEASCALQHTQKTFPGLRSGRWRGAEPEVNIHGHVDGPQMCQTSVSE